MNPDPELLRWTDWIPVIQSVFMFLTVVCSAITVIVAVSKQKTDKESSVKAIEKAEEQARKRAIIDLLIAQKSDPNYIKDSKRECLKFCVCPKFITYVALRRGGSLVERSGTSEPPLRRFRSSHHSILA